MDIPVKDAFNGTLVARDASQARAVELLRQLVSELLQPQEPKSTGLVSRLFVPRESQPAPKGLYIWGGVGRGKTWLMDSFYQSIPIAEKIRLHFHHSAQLLHREMRSLPGYENPLKTIVRQFADKYRLLCLDEFHVSDIGDAMLLEGVLRCLFENGVTLVTTSNRHPDELYKGWVLQEQLLPSVNLLKNNTRIFHLDSGTDYRLDYKTNTPEWFVTPLDDRAREQLEKRFRQLSRGEVFENADLEINHRRIRTLKFSESCAWFDFDQLCNGPRAVSDYIKLAERFSSLIVSSVPVLHEALESAARRFMNLVDELYDRRIRLVLSADVHMEQLYRGEVLSFEFQRTLSRLYQMQSADYSSTAGQTCR